MITIIYLSIYVIIIFLINSLNPVKIRIILILLRSMLFRIFYFNNTSSWFSIIYFIIFIGGIIIIFIILSAIIPNEKNLKTKKLIFSIISISLLPFFFTHRNLNGESQILNQMKWFFKSNLIFEVLILIILRYFLSFIFILSKETSRLRSRIC